MATKTDVSYGVIPIRRGETGWEVFLIKQYSKIGDNTYWVIPKGHPEEGETPQQTARRELKEETGLEAETFYDEPTFELHYSFVHDGDQIEKTVVFFIGIIPDSARVKLHPTEVKEAGWYSLSAAVDRFDYQGIKTLFLKARSYIEENLK